jgi:hypothetical protein
MKAKGNGRRRHHLFHRWHMEMEIIPRTQFLMLSIMLMTCDGFSETKEDAHRVVLRDVTLMTSSGVQRESSTSFRVAFNETSLTSRRVAQRLQLFRSRRAAKFSFHQTSSSRDCVISLAGSFLCQLRDKFLHNSMRQIESSSMMNGEKATKLGSLGRMAF